MVLIAGTMLGRLLGFAREALLARRFGLGEELDVLIAALSVADVLTFFLLGTAMSAAIIPYLARVSAEAPSATGGVTTGAAPRLAGEASALFDAALVCFTLLAGLAAAAALPTIGLLAPGLPDGAAARAASLSRGAMVGVLFTGLTLVQAPVLQVLGRFGVTSVATAIYNAVLVAGLLLFWRRATAELLVGLTVGAAGIRWWAHDAALRREGVRWRPFAAEGQGRAVRAVLVAMPAAMAVAIADIGILVDRHFASRLGEGALATVSLADKLVALPLGVLAGSIAVAALPSLAAARGNWREFRAITHRALARAVGASVGVGAVLLLLPTALVTLAYGGGAFGDAEVSQTAATLSVYALGLPAAAVGLVLGRAAFAAGTLWVAPVAAVVGLLVRALLQASATQQAETGAQAIARGAVAGLLVQGLVLGGWYVLTLARRDPGARTVAGA